ncbi:MAG TPA: hypothetical protein VNM92_03215 [Thermoanaerobaculia bacterium]|nr:hypothetical protein [Thermoanaerobaculia bacterium]
MTPYYGLLLSIPNSRARNTSVSSERIVRYLAEKHSLNINGIFFKFFRQNANELLGRAWLMDSVQVQEHVIAAN